MDIIEKRTRGAYFTSRKEYIEGLSKALNPLQDFDQVKYARTYTTEEEFVRISDVLGKTCFLNVTALPLSEVFKDVVKCALIEELNCLPGSLIVEKAKMREIAPLFK